MKEFFYYSACVLTWIASVFVLAFFYVVISGVSTSIGGWSYALGTGCGQPSIWLTALGFVLLLRKYLYISIMKENKEFSKTASIALIVIGLVWLTISTVSQMKLRQTKQDLYDKYYSMVSMKY